MFAPLVSFVLAAQVVPAPRLLEVLPNGASVFAESVPSADRVSVQLWVSSRNAEETSRNHGHRHLLEHLIAKRLDPIVEARGMFLTAETTRAAVAFKIVATPEQVSEAVEVLQGAWKRIQTTADEIAKEVKIIGHEEALLPHSRRMSRWLWNESGRPNRLDPFGHPAAMLGVSPESLVVLQGRMFAPSNLVVTIVGPMSAASSLEIGRRALTQIVPASPPLLGPSLDSAEPTSVPRSSGSGLGIAVEGLPARSTLAAIGLGLVLNQSLQDMVPVYQPSSRPGLLVLSSTSGGLRQRLGAVEERRLAHGVTLVQQWARSFSRTPERIGSFRGAMLAEGSSLTLDQLEMAARNLSVSDILEAQKRALDGVSTEINR